MNALEIFKALANEYRLRIVNLLMQRDLCVCHIEQLLDISQPAISRHLKKLTDSKIIDFKTDGKYYCYYLKKLNIPKEIIVILNREFKKDIYLEDIKKIKNIRKCLL